MFNCGLSIFNKRILLLLLFELDASLAVALEIVTSDHRDMFYHRPDFVLDVPFRAYCTMF